MMEKLKFPIVCLLWIAFISFIAPLPVAGQTYHSFNWEIARILDQTRWQIGPFRISARINLQSIGYDDNIYREPEQNDPVADYTATISPVVDAFVIFKDRIILDANVNPEYVYFAKTTGERSFNLNFSTGAKFKLFHQFVLSGRYAYDKSRRRANSEFDVRANQLTQNLIGSFFYETARETSFGITGAIRFIAFEDELTPEEEIYLSRQLNRTEAELSGEFYYRLRQETYFFLTGGYADYSFDYKEARWRDSYSFQSLVGVRFPIVGNMRGTVSLGFKKLSPKVGFKKQFAGPIGNTNIEARIKRFIFRGSLSKDVQFSYWTNNVFFVEYIYGAGLSFYLTQFIRLDYDYSSGDNRYPEDMLIRLPDETYELIQRRDKYLSHRVAVVFRVSGNTGLGLRLNYWERNSNDPAWGTRRSMFIGGYIAYNFR